ncbi:haloacid dehalogenase-like hydrolase domain-containing 5 [Gadus macrocephalus]|uniref:haloacid dehalogenase-like hydrolase domain-containing 5 n=1 Tax=Gadus macrocephalus TaxID=80720 RepID=UPI0028CBAD2A|nr:haloacid dehalogenase-like hydrolase domain-containing 5 [Gadus macrocephalus]
MQVLRRRVLDRLFTQTRGLCLDHRSRRSKPGLLVDVDGVLLRGRSVIPAARRVFQRLQDAAGHFRLPVVFVTNAGSCLRHNKAQQLSDMLGIKVTPDQVLLSHGPLQMFQSFHEKCVLVSGQGPVADIAQDLGFTNVVTIDQLREQHPLLDMVDHNRRPSVTVSPQEKRRIEAVILFGEPIRWETNLQLLMDVLLTNGNPASPHCLNMSTQLPVLACNTDLLWLADAPSPRLGHGVFMLCLESVFWKLAGQRLRYEAVMGKPSLLTYQHAELVIRQQTANQGWDTPVTNLYAIGDNLMTDVYGANSYNRYLKQQLAAPAAKALAQGRGTEWRAAPLQVEGQLATPSATQCHSILVCTGVFNPDAALPIEQGTADAELMEPDYIVEDVEAAIDLIFQKEGFDL